MLTEHLRRLAQFYCRHVPLDRGKYRVAAWTYLHLTPHQPTTCVTTLANGLTVEVHINEFIQSMIYYMGYYELYLARYVQTLMQPGRIFADVGAHVGQYTLMAAARRMEAHAFEPDPVNFAYLSRNVQLNHLTVTLNHCAVTDYSGHALLFPYGNETIRNNSLRKVESAPASSRSAITTPVVHLDGYFAGRHHEIAIVKADVEGAELNVLKGAQEILSHSRPILILEVVACNTQAYGYTAYDLKQFLRGFGYQFYTLERTKLVPIPLESQASYENLICIPRAR